MHSSTGVSILHLRSSTFARRARPKRSWTRSTTGIPSSCKLKQTQESRPRSSSPGIFCFQKQSAFGKETCAAGELEGARSASNPIDSRRAAATRSPKVRLGLFGQAVVPGARLRGLFRVERRRLGRQARTQRLKFAARRAILSPDQTPAGHCFYKEIDPCKGLKSTARSS